ncbi:MAG TPA: site-specific DNA-methyltransferase [Pyrinomonadaceae bacterium]|jgi:site-specific DNA-methyltransferase (adenine-specific)
MPQIKQNLQKPIELFINKIIRGDALKALKKFPEGSIDCIVTSPPYWALRDYDVKGQIGLESTIEEYLEKLLAVFAEIRRVLKPTGTCWINFGDTYANKTKGGHRNKLQNNMYDSLTRRATFPKLETKLNIPPKSLCQIPSSFALKMIEQGWILRNEIIWHKPNAMPQSIKDRFSVDFEKIFFFVKERKYYFCQQFEPLKNPVRLERRLLDPKKSHKRTKSYWFSARPEISEKRRLNMLKTGRNKRCVWTIGTTSFPGNHFAVYPPRLIETPIKAGCPKGGIVLDPFIGSGTTAIVAKELGRKFIGIELSSSYVKMARNRLRQN